MGCIFSSMKPSVASLHLNGLISNNRNSLCIQSQQKLIKQAFNTPNVKAVALRINSPGGSPVQTELLYTYIRTLSKRKNIPVYTFIEDVAASGGYWLACAGDEIYASASSIVGSIGVISAGFGFPELLKKIGVERRVYSQGENKNLLDPFKEEKETDIAIINAVGCDIHQEFIDLVKSRRGEKLADDPQLFTGAFWSGKKAKELGLVDGNGCMYEILNDKFGKISVIEIKKKQGLLHTILFGISADGLVGSLFTALHTRIALSRYHL